MREGFMNMREEAEYILDKDIDGGKIYCPRICREVAQAYLDLLELIPQVLEEQRVDCSIDIYTQPKLLELLNKLPPPESE